MKEPFEVKEFDIIITNPEYKDNSSYKYLEKNEFDHLSNFIDEFSTAEDNTDILVFMRKGYQRNVKSTITIQNYVGLIQMKNGFQIQILPKICLDVNEDKDNKQTKRIFLKMLRTMKDFPSKVFQTSSLQVDKMNLYEIFINMYLQEVRLLVKHGLKSSYVTQEDNLNFFKGKLQVSQHIKDNLVHKERFYVSYDEFHLNRAENKIVKATLLKLQQLTNSAQNAKEIRQLLMSFEMVEPSIHYEKDFAKVVLNRNTIDYKNLMKWSKVFLMNKSFTTFSGQTQSRSLLFPMESIYERYVSIHLKRIMESYGWNVSIQDHKHYLFVEPKKQFALHPDIVIEKEGRIIILDTKWKRLTNQPNKNYGITQADMYQMYAYSKKYHASEIWLLYPLNEEMLNCKDDIVFNSGDGTIVRVYFIDIANIEDSIEKLKEKIEDKMRY